MVLQRSSAAGRFVKFGIVGATGVAVNTAMLYVGHELGGLPLVLASALAVEIAIIHNFLWNNLWTFSQKSIDLHRLVKFNLVSLGGLLITVLVLYSLVEWLDLHYLVANLLAIACATSWNFFVNSFWTWGGVS